ncbi:hypothetical protein RBB80_09540 [Tunturiibacter gelidiferens]
MDRTCADDSQVPQAQPYGALRQAARAHSGSSIIQTISIDYLTIEAPLFEANLPANTHVGHRGPFAGIQAQSGIDLRSAPSIFEVSSPIQPGQLSDAAGSRVTIVVRYATRIPSGALICLWIDCEWNPPSGGLTEAFTRIIGSRRGLAPSRHAWRSSFLTSPCSVQGPVVGSDYCGGLFGVSAHDFSAFGFLFARP